MDHKAEAAASRKQQIRNIKGNSARGVAANKDLADDLGLHAFECSNIGSAYVRSLILGAN